MLHMQSFCTLHDLGTYTPTAAAAVRLRVWLKRVVKVVSVSPSSSSRPFVVGVAMTSIIGVAMTYTVGVAVGVAVGVVMSSTMRMAMTWYIV